MIYMSEWWFWFYLQFCSSLFLHSLEVKVSCKIVEPVFRTILRSAINSLVICLVMAILNNRLDTRHWLEMQAAIEDGSANSEFLSSLNSRLQTNDGESRLAFREAMIQYVDNGQHRLIDLVRRILQLKNDGYEEDVDKVLDKIGEIVESWMPS